MIVALRPFAQVRSHVPQVEYRSTKAQPEKRTTQKQYVRSDRDRLFTPPTLALFQISVSSTYITKSRKERIRMLGFVVSILLTTICSLKKPDQKRPNLAIHNLILQYTR
jgi:hypothetical protein